MSKSKKSNRTTSELPDEGRLSNKLHLDCSVHLNGLIFDGEIEHYDVEDEDNPTREAYDVKFREGGWISVVIRNGMVDVLFCEGVALKYEGGGYLTVVPTGHLDD